MGFTSFLGFSCTGLLLAFYLNLLFPGTYNIYFRKCWDFLFLFLFCFSVSYFGLACDQGNSFIFLEE